MIYLTSDFHFFHDRGFMYEPRGFKSVYEMNDAIIENYNKVVNPEDDVYVLGDLLLGGPDSLDKGLKLIGELNGKLHLVRGNHDTDTRWFTYSTLQNVVEQQNAIYLKYKGFHFYMSHYPCITCNNDYNKPLKQRTLSLCGHSHTKNPWQDNDKGYIYHVELDAHNNFPCNLDNIIEDFKKMYYLY